MGKMLYFVEHTGNSAQATEPAERAHWVAVYEYVSSAPGRGKKPRIDPATEHPVYDVHGQADLPSVFLVAAICRHVSLTYACPAGRCCPRGTPQRPQSRSKEPTWNCHLTIAESGDREMDSYLLNDHHHRICRPAVYL